MISDYEVEKLKQAVESLMGTIEEKVNISSRQTDRWTHRQTDGQSLATFFKLFR